MRVTCVLMVVSPDDQSLGDLSVAHPGDEIPEHLPLARGEVIESRWGPDRNPGGGKLLDRASGDARREESVAVARRMNAGDQPLLGSDTDFELVSLNVTATDSHIDWCVDLSAAKS